MCLPFKIISVSTRDTLLVHDNALCLSPGAKHVTLEDKVGINNYHTTTRHTKCGHYLGYTVNTLFVARRTINKILAIRNVFNHNMIVLKDDDNQSHISPNIKYSIKPCHLERIFLTARLGTINSHSLNIALQNYIENSCSVILDPSYDIK